MWCKKDKIDSINIYCFTSIYSSVIHDHDGKTNDGKTNDGKTNDGNVTCRACKTIYIHLFTI
jgi:hypothetical protein